MQTLYDRLETLYGVVLVFQPTDIAAADLIRTLDLLQIKKIPVLGLVVNMSYCIAPSGEQFWPYISPRVEIADLCKEHGIPVLGEVPLTPSQQILNKHFDSVVASMLACEPKVLAPGVFSKVYKGIKRKALKEIIRRL